MLIVTARVGEEAVVFLFSKDHIPLALKSTSLNHIDLEATSVVGIV